MIFLIAFLFSFSVFAQELPSANDVAPGVQSNEVSPVVPTPAQELTSPEITPIRPVQTPMDQSKSIRSLKPYSAMLTFAPYDMWIPGKWGFSVAYTQNAESIWELEIISGSLSGDYFNVDLGKLSDQRISLLRRSFAGRNSFHYFYGFEYTNLKVTLGDDLFSSVTGDPYSVDLLKISTLGLAWGFGNRWYHPNGFTWGVDWFTLNIPLVVLGKNDDYLDATSDSDDKNEVEDAIRLFEKLPTLGIFKLQVGYSF